MDNGGGDGDGDDNGGGDGDGDGDDNGSGLVMVMIRTIICTLTAHHSRGMHSEWLDLASLGDQGGVCLRHPIVAGQESECRDWGQCKRPRVRGCV